MNTSSKSDNFLAQFKDINSNSLKYFTAAQFVEVWNHYDTDGNGYIEGSELDNFLREFIYSVFSEELGNETPKRNNLSLLSELTNE
ncbi:unnamed protein product [Schistosoma mattheei]|uniref:EF-hand domain-containing protein n=1 Tax=Schistosoma mattheei TaxID=31246 RepID=A0AA85B100_9TREM|nr:unnamed protein product [Schistosoma mattheei]